MLPVRIGEKLRGATLNLKPPEKLRKSLFITLAESRHRVFGVSESSCTVILHPLRIFLGGQARVHAEV